MKKLWKFLGSMRFAILLLVILSAACAGGSFIPQGLDFQAYAARYSERTAGLILALGLEDVFHCWWFLLLTAFLCGNLLLCNLVRLPQLIRRWKNAADPAHFGAPAVKTGGIRDPEAFFAALRMPKPARAADAAGRPLLYSVQNRVGLWGAWVCHLGILLLILGFVLGQVTKEEYTVYGVPGQTLPIGETGYELQIRDFRTDRREDGFVEQYEADIAVRPRSDPAQARQQQISVNHPGSAFGFKFYQNSTGDAARLTVCKDGETVQENIVCVGDGVRMLQTPLYLILRSYVPDFMQAPDGGSLAGYAYQIYIDDQFYTMDVQLEGETVPHFTPYEVRFSDPQSYTLIQVKRDRFTLLVLAGGLVTLLGLLLAFYLQMKKVWAVREPDGAWTVCGVCPKGGALFAEQFRRAAGLPEDASVQAEPEIAGEPEASAPDKPADPEAPEPGQAPSNLEESR